MYIYYRQCYRSLKPAAIFPIEVELGINLKDPSKRNEELVESHDFNDKSCDPEDQSQPPIDDLLLDLGIPDESNAPPLSHDQMAPIPNIEQ